MKLTFDIMEEQCEIVVKNNDMEAWLTLKEPGEVIEYEAEPIMQYLAEKGIVQGIKKRAVARAIKEKKYNTPILVAEGIPATAGENGYFEFFFEKDLQPKPTEQKDGSVDYLNMKLFEEAVEGQLLVRYHPATKGMYGFTVRKKILKALDGKNKPVLKGKGFEYNAETQEYYATKSGRIVYADNFLKIDPLYVIDEVNYSTGNIRFNGDVLIKGNVRSGMRVEASGDIMVNGNIESATIISEKNILIKRGATTDSKCDIVAGGNVSGKFFEGITIQAESVFSDYYLNCQINATKTVTATGRKGIIAGGVTNCKEEVVVTHLGNNAGIRTLVNMYYEEEPEENREECMLQMEAIQDEKEMILNEIARFKREFKGEDISRSLQYMKLEYQLRMRDTAIKELKTKFDELQSPNMKKKAHIVIKGIAYAGSKINFGSVEEYINTSQKEVQYCRIGDRIIKESIAEI